MNLTKMDDKLICDILRQKGYDIGFRGLAINNNSLSAECIKLEIKPNPVYKEFYEMGWSKGNKDYSYLKGYGVL